MLRVNLNYLYLRDALLHFTIEPISAFVVLGSIQNCFPCRRAVAVRTTSGLIGRMGLG